MAIELNWRIGLIGLGNVGQGFIRILRDKENILKAKYGFEFKLVGIADPIKGSAYDLEGLDLKILTDLLDRYGNIRRYDAKDIVDSLRLAKVPDIDIIVETTPTNLDTGEPGYTHIKTALEEKKHVVTSNKGPIALAYRKLRDIAYENNVELRFEGTVLSGTPAISLVKDALAGCQIMKITGIVNGTTNFILSEMEKGFSYNDALKKAQDMGYAEADPSGDVDGWDSAVKAVIMANVLMNGDISLRKVYREGIRSITLKDIEGALKNRKRIKLLTRIYRENDHVNAYVKPTRIPLSHPLANIQGVLNALIFKTDHLGEVMITGPGAGRKETGQALLSDILYIHRLYK